MHYAKLLISAALGAACLPALAQLDKGVGGAIDSMATPSTQYTTASQAIPLLTQNIGRYFANVYQANEKHGSVTWVDNPSGTGKVFRAYVTKPSLAPDDKYSRAEVAPKWDYIISGVRWYGFSFYLPESWQENQADMIVGQLHTSTAEGIVLSPPVSIDIKGPYINLALHASELSPDPTQTPHLEKDTSSEQVIRLGTYERKKWYCVVVRANWSYTPGQGDMQVWLNGKSVYEAHNAYNAYPIYRSGVGNYAKAGLYVPGGNGMPDSQEVYTSYVYLGGTNDTLSQQEITAAMPCAQQQG